MADPPSPSGAQYSQQHPTSPSLAQTLGECGYRSQPTGSPMPHPTPAAPMGGSSQRGKEAEVPPHATPPLCCGAPEHSMHPVESAAASRASHWSLRTKPTCYSAADHGLFPGEVHSFSGHQSPSQGPPNPVRHLLSR